MFSDSAPDSVVQIIVTFSCRIDDTGDLIIEAPETEASPNQYCPPNLANKIAFAAGVYHCANEGTGNRNNIDEYLHYLSIDLHDEISKTLPNITFTKGELRLATEKHGRQWNRGTVTITFERSFGKIPPF